MSKFSKAIKKATKGFKQSFKNHFSKDFLLSPARWAMSAYTFGLSEATNAGNWYSKQKWSTYSDIAIAAAVGAAAAGAIGGAGAAAGGVSGAGAAGAGAGATTAGTAAAAGSISTGSALTGAALATSGLGAAQQAVATREASKEQSRAQARAEANALAAERESEILRKRALLASQKSMTARRAAAGAISNKLKNTSGYLGDDEERLGD